MNKGRAIRDFTTDELRAYAEEHVLYEITHFVRATQAVEAARGYVFPMNFALEVFALHLRNLLDFFAPRGKEPRETDALASHFYPDWDPPKLDLYLREARWMADKRVAHLTSARTDDVDAKIWAVDPIVQSMTPIIRRFTDGATLVSEGFREEVADRLAELPPLRDTQNMPPRRQDVTGDETTR